MNRTELERAKGTQMPDKSSQKIELANLADMKALQAIAAENVRWQFSQLRTNSMDTRLPLRNSDLFERSEQYINEELMGFLDSRFSRGTELGSKELTEVTAIAERVMGKITHFDFGCIDGRNPPTLKIAKVPFVGAAYRTPAGVIEGFSGLETGRIVVDWNSPIVRSFKFLLKKHLSNDGTVVFSFDTHLGCAAAGLQGSDCVINDEGRAKNLAIKLHLEVGFKMIVQKLIEEKKLDVDANRRLKFVHYAYDSHTGTIVHGLDAVAQREELAHSGLTDKFIQECEDKGWLLDSARLLADDVIARELANVLKPHSLDLRTEYVSSLHRVWEAVEKLWQKGEGSVYKKLYDKVQLLYSSNKWLVLKDLNVDDYENRKVSEFKLTFITKLVLRNLLMRWGISGKGGLHHETKATTEHHEWPFGQHQESCIVVTVGGYAPFKSHDAFSVNADDLDGIVANISLAEMIVRGNRASGAVTSQIFKDKQEFKAAPVLLINKGILTGLSEDIWEILEKIDWKTVEQQFQAVNFDIDNMSALDILIKLGLSGQVIQGVTLEELQDFAKDIVVSLARFFRIKSIIEGRLASKLGTGALFLECIVTDEKRKPRIVL